MVCLSKFLKMKQYDINADLGEGTGIESEIMPLIDSCNIACGGHAGDFIEMNRIVALAKKNNVLLGAHPSYPDPKNFGRKSMEIETSILFKSLSEQLLSFLNVLGSSPLHHVKPHGALYLKCINDTQTALVMIDVIESLSPNSIIYTLPNGQIDILAKERGLKVWHEAFIDRRYQDSGQLVVRTDSQAIISDKSELYDQFFHLVYNKKVQTQSGNWISINPKTLCIHGDHFNTLKNLKFILKMDRIAQKR